MATIVNEAQQSRGVPPRGRSAAMQGFDLAIDDKTATDIYNRIDATEGLERDVLATQLENWASRKIAENENTAAQEHERIYTDLDGWWSDRGGDEVPEDVKFGAANRKFIADQFNQTASEQGDLYPSYRDQYFLKTYGKAPASESEAYKTISESIAATQKVNQSYDLITGDIALALFDQVNKGTPVDVPALFTKWKEENAEILSALPDDWEANALKAAGQYYAENEKMLREHGDVLQRLYARIVETTGRKVEGAPENDVKTVEDLNAIIDELGQLPKEVRDRGYTAILMAARRQGMEDKGFWEMAAEAWPRTLNTVRTTGLVAQETDAEAKVNLLRGNNPIFINKATGQVTPPSGTAFSPQDFEPVTDEQRGELLQQAETELQRFNVIRELRDLADNRFDPVKSNAKNGVLKFVQDIALMGPQSLAYTAMAAIPVAGPFLTGAAIYADEYNQLRLEGMSSAQARTLSLVSAPLQTAAEVFGAKLIFGRYKWYRETIQKLINPARFARSSQAAVSFFGKVVGENITEGFQDLATPLVKDVASALSEEYPDVNWEQTFEQWKDSRLEVLAATLMPVIGGSLVETFNNNERFASARRRVQLLYKPMGITDEEVRYIEDGTTPEERNKRYTETLAGMSAERVQAVKDNIASQSRLATGTQEDATQPTLETQKDANGRLTYIVRDETGKEVYRSTKQAAAEEAFVLTTARSTATRFNEEKVQLRELVEWWNTADPKRSDNEERVVRDTIQGTAQQKLEALQQANNKQGIEELHRRIAQSPYAGTPYDQIQILGEASVEQVGEMVFRSVIALNKNSRVRDAREEMHHTAVRMAVANGRVNEQTMREWLDATERVFAEKGLGITLPRADMTDIVESMAVVQEAFENERISADVEMSLPQAFVDYIKRMIQVLAEVLKRGKAIREALDAGMLPAEFEAFLVETTGVADQTAVDRARERTEQEVGAQQNYSIGVSSQQDTDYLAAVERGDMETAQRMVDEAARAAGFSTKVWHSSTGETWTDVKDEPIYVAKDKSMAEWATQTRAKPFYTNLSPQEIKKVAKWKLSKRGGQSEMAKKLVEQGFSAAEGIMYPFTQKGQTEILMAAPAGKIKSADPVTYDASGNVIPLSQRFDATTPNINYSIVRSVDHFKNDTRFDKLVKDGRVFTGVDVNDFIDQHILLHSPDNAFAGTIQLTDGGEIKGKGGVYYPALYADDNYFWASTEAMVMRTANHLNEIGAKNGGRILMGLVSAPVEKLFSSTSMSTGVVKFLNALTNDPRAGLSKDDLNAMLVAASKVEVVVQTKTKTTKKTFSTKLKESDSYAKNFAKIDELLAPDGSIFQVRKAFVESLADQISKHLNATPATAEYVAGILADAENKHAKNAIKRGKLSKASFLQGLGNMLTEPFLRDFQQHGNGKIYAIVEVQGEVKGIATTEHESYPATIVPVNKKSKVKLHVLKEAVDWQDVVGKETGQYATPQERLNLLPTSGMSSTNLKVLGVKAGSSTAPINYSIGNQRDIINDAIVRLGGESATMTSNTAWMTPSAKFLNVGAHGHADILGDKFQISVVDYMNLGFVRLNARESGKLYADGFRLTPRQVAELKSTAIEKQLELVIERGTQDQQHYSIGVPTKKQRLDLTRYSEEDAINIIMFLDALAQRQTNQGINEQWFIRAYRALPQTFKDVIAYDGEDTLFRGTDPDFNYQEDAAKGYISQMTMTFTSQESYAKWFGSNVISTDPAVLEAAGVPAFTDSIDTGKVREMYNRRANKNMLFNYIGHDIEVGDDEGEIIMIMDDGRALDDAEVMSIYDDEFQDLRERHEREGIIEKIRNSNYSISTQSEIDRVQAAMGALDRSPLGRLKVYEKMQERFLRVMSDNRETLAAMEGGDLSQVRRTQILQALGELDGIISSLPTEIRAKIGGYTQLAKVDPMDVFKGDQKVSEVRGMSGAIISAWMREGLNIGQAQKKTELPAGYRAERNLDPTRADRAIADVFIQRINRINEALEKFLRDEYNDAAVELFKRAKPQRSGAGEKPKGKLGADVHALFDTLKEATEWSAEEAQAWADGQWARIEAGELNPYEEAHATLAAQVIPLFADWANADSTQRAAAVAMGKDILDRAYKGEQQRIIAQRTKRGYDRTDLSKDAGVSAEDDKARQNAVKRENSLPSKWEAAMLNLLNFDQVLRYVFGNDSKIARQISDRQRKADNAKSDDVAALSDEWATFLTMLGGGQMEGQQLLFDLSRMDEEIDGVAYSQNQLVAITMMWMQPKGRQHMEGFMDSDGQPAGKWHYNQAFVNKAEKLLRPESKAIRKYLLRKYDEEYEAINKVYRKVYGLNLPKNQFYSPLVVESIAAPEQAGIDPVTGGVFAAGANSPSALRSRGGAIAQPVFRDAVQTYFGHMLQMAHWKAYAEFNSEVSALLGHRDTRNVVKGKAGEQAATVMNNWLQYFQQGGNKDAANHLAINQWINRITGNFAAISLFGRVSTLALQVTQLGAASAKMPVGAYLSRFGKLMSGRLGWTTALDSDYIQRRIKDMPPAVALAMQGLRAEKPSQIRNAARWLGQHLSGFDGFFTAGTYAIVYDYQLSQARQNGMGGQEAADYAREATERIVDEIAQPTRAGARSIYELNSTNPVARAVWAFSSESRKNMGLLMASGAVGGKRNFGKALTYVLLLNGLVGIVIRNAFRDMRDDDDDEVFDEKNWGWKRLAAQFISDPIYGIPVVGETIEGAIYTAFGVYKPSGSVFDVARGVPAATRMVTQYPAQLLEGEAEFRDIVADVNRVLAAAGLFNSNIAAAASISNLAKDVFEVTDNALGDE